MRLPRPAHGSSTDWGPRARAVRAMDDHSAAATVRSVQEAVVGASNEPLSDDAATVVLAVR